MSTLVQSLTHTWEPFVLIIGLLFIGHVAANEGLFGYVGADVRVDPRRRRLAVVSTMVSVALVTAVLNLDTAVVFMTPVALRAAKSRSADETAFLYGTILMANSASLLRSGLESHELLDLRESTGRGIRVRQAHVVALDRVGRDYVRCRRNLALVATLRGIGDAEDRAATVLVGTGLRGVIAAIVTMLVLSYP